MHCCPSTSQNRTTASWTATSCSSVVRTHTLYRRYFISASFTLLWENNKLMHTCIYVYERWDIIMELWEFRWRWMKTQSIVLNLMLNAISSHIRINLVCSLITVKKCGLHLVSLVVLGGFCVCVCGGVHFFSFCLHLQSGQPSIPCLVFIISPSVSWFLLTLPWPRCLSVSLPGLLSVHLRTCSAFPLFLNATLTLLYAGFSSRHPLSLSVSLSLLGELYDLDAASLQLKVINYVSGLRSLMHFHTHTHNLHTHTHCVLNMYSTFKT